MNSGWWDQLNAQVNQRILTDAANKGILTLGELIDRLTPLNPSLTVCFDDGKYPGYFDSYRGYYDHLALSGISTHATVGSLLGEAEKALNTVFEGYKGGEYRMTRATPIWYSQYGISSGIGLIEVMPGQDEVVILTKKIDLL